MKRLLSLIVLTVFLLTLTTFSAVPNDAEWLPSKDEVIRVMRLVNDYWIDGHPTYGNNQWARAVYYEGDIAIYNATKDEKYLNYALAWANANKWALNGGNTTSNADNQTCGQTYIDLYNLCPETRQESWISNIKACIDNMNISSTSNAQWWWIDALQMAMPVFTKLGVLYNDTKYFDKMYTLYNHTKNHEGTTALPYGLFSGNSHYKSSDNLWWRDRTFLTKKSQNGENVYWSRGNGWVFAALARVMDEIPSSDAHFQEYKTTFKKMAAALIPLQQQDGFWHTSLKDPKLYDNPETSGTAFFVYGMAWGIKVGILDKATYMPIVTKGWNSMVEKAVHSNGFLGYIQPVGLDPKVATYDSTPTEYDKLDFGVGAFLLAGSEVANLCNIYGFYDQNDNKLKSFNEATDLNFKANINNIWNTTLNAKFITAIYNNKNKLKSVEIRDVEITEPYADITQKINVSQTQTGDSVKILIWSDDNQIYPLITAQYLENAN